MDWVAAYDGFLGRLDGVEDYGNGRGRARCPCDPTHDLWLAVGHEGQLVARCYPRSSKDHPCTLVSVVTSAGVDLRYLFPDWREKIMAAKKDRGAATLEATHSYYDQNAKGEWFLAFEVLRKRYHNGDKDMPQRRPNPDHDKNKPVSDANPKHVYNINGVRPVLYRMKELRDGLRAAAKRWVFVQEGEVKVEQARELGLLSTCCPMGALKWNQPWYKDELRGANVIVIPDEDAADPTSGLARGLEHAKQVCRDLLGVAAIIRVVRIPDPEFPGYDFVDWRKKQTGKTDDIKSAIMAMVNAATAIEDLKQIEELQPFPFPVTASPPVVPPPPPAVAKSEPAVAKDTTSTAPQSHLSAMAELEGMIRALNAASPVPRSMFEWLGEITVASNRFDKVFDVANPNIVREAALAFSAAIMRGVRS